MAVLSMWCVSAPFVMLFGLMPGACQSPTSPDAADVVIARSQFGQTVSVKKGQTLSIAPPADFRNGRWITPPRCCSRSRLPTGCDRRGLTAGGSRPSPQVKPTSC